MDDKKNKDADALHWALRNRDPLDLPWPLDENGDHEEAAWLANIRGSEIEFELSVAMLRSFGIPVVRSFPQSGRFMRVIAGYSGGGMDIYVPKSMHETAAGLLSGGGEIIEEDSLAAQAEFARWLRSGAVPPELINELRAIEDDPEQIEERFFAPLKFGTAGLRGVIGAGVNRMNILVVRQATQAMAELILREGGGDCAVCHDCRFFSREFAAQAACVLAANGVRALLFEDMRPTPELSFAIREYKCMAGINITASHNPKEYNGYKAYWSDGAQLQPEHASAVAREMEDIDVLGGAKTMDYEQAVKLGLIVSLGSETDELYYARVLSESVKDEKTLAAMSELKVVFTPFHGAGAAAVPEILRRSGIPGVHCVESQMTPDGGFPTVKSPNPEEPEGFALALELAQKVGADIIIATDPDSDRVGAMAKHKNDYTAISGNQMGVLLTDYILGAKARSGTLPANAVIIKTIVTTELARRVAESYGAGCIDTFTGFKFMAEKIKQFEVTGEYSAVFSFEESCGYMPGTFVRDKDAVSASMLIAEMTAYHLSYGRSLVEALIELYNRHGFFREKTLNLIMPGQDGQKKMEELMGSLRGEPPKAVGGREVLAVCDYLTGERRLKNGEVEAMELQGSDVLKLEMEGGVSLLARPSGTEPKMKIYALASGKTAGECNGALEDLVKFAEDLEIQ